MNNKIHIGLLLAFAPGQSLKNHGIGRLTCFLISAAQNQAKFIIAIPKWYKNEILELFHDHNISPDQYNLLVTANEPYLLRLKNLIAFFTRRASQCRSKNISNHFISKASKKVIDFFVHSITSSTFLSFLPSIFLAVVFIIILFSMVYIWLLFGFLFFIAYFLFPYRKRYTKHFTWLSQPLKYFKNNHIARKFYDSIQKQELNKLIKLLNSQKDMNVCFIPTLFWPEISAIKAKTVVAAPDIVFLDFPSLFAKDYYYRVYQKISQTIKLANHLICYSNYVKQQHLIEKLQVSAEKVSVIPHGMIDLALYLAKNPSQSMTNNAKSILKKYQQEYLSTDNYLSDFDFTNSRFIFYSSQIRPHKNFLNLLRAYEILLRQKYLGIKLIITGNIAENDFVAEFIKSRRLTYDVLSFHHIPSTMLAALNHLAICAVNPTLFEGGFPFTFSEAYSVNTPSVMSKIAVVEEVIDAQELKKIMLFDPYSVDDMVAKIAWAIEHPIELYQAQKPLYEKLAQRSWENVAQEYLKVFTKQ